MYSMAVKLAGQPNLEARARMEVDGVNYLACSLVQQDEVQIVPVVVFDGNTVVVQQFNGLCFCRDKPENQKEED